MRAHPRNTRFTNMRICYLASDPRMRLAAPTGYGSHIRKTIAALERQGYDVLKIIAGDQRDITTSRSFYRKLGRPSSRIARWIKSAARDIYELADDYSSGIHYRRLLAGSPSDCLYERMAPFRSVGRRLAGRFSLPWILEVSDPLYVTLRFYPSSFRWYALRTEKRLIRGATGIIVGSERLKAYYIGQGIAQSKL